MASVKLTHCAQDHRTILKNTFEGGKTVNSLLS